MIDKMLKDRSLPWIEGREEMLSLLCREEYGALPDIEWGASFEVLKNIQKNFCAGKAVLDRVDITLSTERGSHTFPCYAAVPKSEKRVPFFVNIGFDPSIPNKYLPIEEIVDRGYGVLYIPYKEVTSDDGDFDNGSASLFCYDRENDPYSSGKLMLWAFSASLALNYAESDERLDMSSVTVCGHSRLGKTALLAAALDTRFSFAYSNDSGASGAALSRGKSGENIEAITRRFPYWFCPKYAEYKDREEYLPFDQHWLLASILPRHIYVASALDDVWADPISEYLCCCAAGNKGEFIHTNRLPEAGDIFHEGKIGYHLRSGAHYFSREDWNKYIDFHIASTSKK